MNISKTSSEAETAESAHESPSSIDLISPTMAGDLLDVSSEELLCLVNTGRLAAYCVGGEIRFRSREVATLAPRLAMAC